jgi:low temperature requirement protein LtrA
MGLPGESPHGRPGRPVGVSWLELFYDLVMVATTIVFSHSIAHQPTWEHAAWTAAMFSLIWWVWLLTTLNMNLDDSEDMVKRVLVFAQMLIVVLITIAGGHAVDPRAEAIGPLYGGMLVAVAALAERTRRVRPELAHLAARRRNALVVAGVLIGISVAFPVGVEVPLWLLGMLLAVVPVFTTAVDRGDGSPTLVIGHLVERLGALTTVVMGEAFITVALTATNRPLHATNFIVMCFEFVIICSVGIAYFDDMASAGMAASRGRQHLWMVSHLPLHLATIGLAVGLGNFVALSTGAHLAAVDVCLLAVPLALVFLSLGLLDALGPREPWMPLFFLRLTSAVAVVVVGVLCWRASFATVEVATAAFGLLALAHIAVASPLRRRTGVGAGVASAA